MYDHYAKSILCSAENLCFKYIISCPWWNEKHK